MRTALMAAVLLAGCGEDFTECALGELTGTWRVSYDETDGNCGPISDETVVFGGGSPTPNCVLYTDQISDDRCEQAIDFECPIDGGAGTIRWVIVWDHVAEGRIVGTGTAQLDHSTLGSCRSTYDIEAERL